ncbi:hypothetical protein ASF49_01595 [Methylobacterium sp. Leaf104]|uniref:recombinase family protein n=1 Tax=Methylobacterium TaxID=407 RepID=UPI0006F50424|nr:MULTISPECIES: recombinase family protein [Methylobacterium]KQP42567.1 hypothetical protein ASF49_01595 [Methylobacterium sp. Leaf104]MCI9878885.1 recombinase family protein [Methylobacterium goesingense]
MPKAYSYIRFSRPEQLRGDSLRRQVAKANEWAEKRGVLIDESLRDIGVSAFRGANRIKGALGRFHDLVENGDVPRGSYLIIESLDRFSRQTAREVLPDFLALINAGIVIVTLIDGQEYSAESIDKEPMGLFGSLMVIMRSHEESKTKSSRLADLWKGKRAAAKESAAVMTSRLPGWLHTVERDGKRCIAFRPAEGDRPDGREVVRRIFVEAIAGYGRRTIATRLNKEGWSTFAGGKKWHPSYILKILQSRATYGEHQSYRFDEKGKREPVGAPLPGYYPAAVTETDFVRANSSRENRAPAAGRIGHAGVANLLKGIAHCQCGGRMARVYKGQGSKGGAYLVCADASRGDCGNVRRWRLDWAEEQVLARTSRIDFAKVLAKAEDGEPRGPTPAELEATITDMTSRLARVTEMIEHGLDGMMERAVDLNRQLKQAKAERAAMKRLGARAAAEPSPEQRRVAMAALRARLAAASEEERAELRTKLAQQIRAAFQKVVFGPNEIQVAFKGVVPYGKVAVQRTKIVMIWTDHPDAMFDLATMELDPETLVNQDRTVSEFIRLSRLRRSEQIEAPLTIEDDTLLPSL